MNTKLPTYKGFKYRITGEAGDYCVLVWLEKPYLKAESMNGSFKTKAIARHMAQSFINNWIDL